MFDGNWMTSESHRAGNLTAPSVSGPHDLLVKVWQRIKGFYFTSLSTQKQNIRL